VVLLLGSTALGFSQAGGAELTPGGGFPRKLGDFDGDGVATVLDIVRLANHLNGTAPLPPDLLLFADVNQDGIVDSRDVTAIAQAVLALTPLPDLPDSDGDGLPDPWEILLGLDPHNPDTDGNGILDGDEDSDHDGLKNKWEARYGYDPRDPSMHKIPKPGGGYLLDSEEDPDFSKPAVSPTSKSAACGTIRRALMLTTIRRFGNPRYSRFGNLRSAFCTWKSRGPGTSLLVSTAAIFLFLACSSPLPAQQDLPLTSTSTGADGPLTFREILPSGRYEHAMAYDTNRHEVVLFGGANAGNDTWIFDRTNWLARTPAAAPAARYNHAMAYDEARKRVILFGGYRPDRGVSTNETWSWDGMTWTSLTPTDRPPARQGSKMVYDRARAQILMFGGSGSTYFNDTWAWDGTNWAQLNPSSPPPEDADSHFSMAYDDARQKAVLFYAAPNPTRTFTWDGSDWSEQSPDTKPAYDPAGTRVMAFDANLGKVILFGGDVCCWTPQNWTWSWDGTNWALLSPATAPPGRDGTAMVTDSERRQLVLFSGNGQPADTHVEFHHH